jgi:N-acylneuraminate cytidylyltransferase
MKAMYVIPARGGSKGLPGKNIRLLGGKPLIAYSIEAARQMAADDDIYVSTDDAEIRAVAEACGLPVPFLRPAELATDTAGTYEVLLHALDFAEAQGKSYDCLLLLQPTSPFRLKRHLEEALALLAAHEAAEMVVSVKITRANPYYLLALEDGSGYLRPFAEGGFTRRQDAPPVYEYNGSLYAIRCSALRAHRSFATFTRRLKYVMEELFSLDIDTLEDWRYGECLLNANLIPHG